MMAIAPRMLMLCEPPTVPILIVGLKRRSVAAELRGTSSVRSRGAKARLRPRLCENSGAVEGSPLRPFWAAATAASRRQSAANPDPRMAAAQKIVLQIRGAPEFSHWLDPSRTFGRSAYRQRDWLRATDPGRKRNGYFGDSWPEKRMASSRPSPVACKCS